jgi:hypothetical protein
LLPACLLLFVGPLYATPDAHYHQIDPHLRTHAGQQYQYTYTSSQPAYMGLGVAAQAAFSEAEQITGALLGDNGVATAAMTQVRPALQRPEQQQQSTHFCPYYHTAKRKCSCVTL